MSLAAPRSSRPRRTPCWDGVERAVITIPISDLTRRIAETERLLAEETQG